MERFHTLGLEISAVLVIDFKVKGLIGYQTEHQVAVIDAAAAKHVLDANGP